MFAPGSLRTACIALLIGGALFGGAGIGLYVRSLWLAEAVAAGAAQAEAACLAAARGLGGDVSVADHTLHLLLPQTLDQRTSLTDASGVLAAGPDWTLSYFCMGRECGAGGGVGMRMDLRRSGR